MIGSGRCFLNPFFPETQNAKVAEAIPVWIRV